MNRPAHDNVVVNNIGWVDEEQETQTRRRARDCWSAAKWCQRLDSNVRHSWTELTQLFLQ